MSLTVETPAFATAIEAAAYIESLLRRYVQKDPSAIHIDSRKADTERDGSKIHVTELAADCLRAAYFRLNDTPRDYDDEVDAHWSHIGAIAEEWVRAVFRAEFPGRLRAQMAVPELPEGVGGTLDLWWRDSLVVIDVKSRRIGWVPGDKERRQVATYAAHLSKKYGATVHAVLVAIPRDDFSKISAYPVEYAQEAVLQSTSERAAYLLGCVDSRTPPPVMPQFAADRFPCSFMTRDGEKRCPYFSQCHADSKGIQPVPSSPQVQEWMREHRALAEQASALEKQAKEIKEGRKAELEALMQPLFEEVGGYVEGPEDTDKDLKRIAFAGRTSYNFEEAFAKHPEVERTLEPFKSVGAGYYQWRYVNKKTAKGKK